MSTYLVTLLENEQVQKFYNVNAEYISEAEIVLDDFRKKMKHYVLEHSEAFLGSSIEETQRNVMTFSETATAQFAAELSSILSEVCFHEMEEMTRSSNDYF